MNIGEAISLFGNEFSSHHAMTTPSVDHISILLSLGHLNGVALNPHAPAFILELMAETHLCQLRLRKSTPPSVAKKLLMEHGSRYVNMVASIAPEDIDEILFGDVMMPAIAYHPEISHDSMMKSLSMGSQFKRYLASNPSATPEVLRHIYKGERGVQLRSILRNPNCPHDILMHHVDDNMMPFGGNPALPREIVNYVISNRERYAINSFYSFAKRSSSMCDEDFRKLYAEDKSTDSLMSLAQNPNTPHDVIVDIFNNNVGSSFVWELAFEHPNMDRDTIMSNINLLHNSENYPVRYEGALANRNLTIDDLSQLVDDGVVSTWNEGIMANPHMTPEVAMRYIEKGYKGVREKLNPSCGPQYTMYPFVNKDVAQCMIDNGHICAPHAVSKVMNDSL